MTNIRSYRPLIAAYVLVCIASAVTAAMLKGIWYDEFFSQFFARHDLSLVDTYRFRWSADVHPIFIYAWGWLFEPVTGSNIGFLRLLNLIPALLAASAVLWIERRSVVMGRVPTLALLLFIASPLVFDYFVQDRPYFWIVASGLVVSVIVVRVERDGSFSRSLAGALSLVTVVFINMQFLCGLFSASGLTAIAISWWIRGRRSWATVLLASVSLASVLILVQAYGQSDILFLTSRHSWIKTTPSGALITIMMSIGLTLFGNIIILFHARRLERDVFSCLLFVGVVFLVAMIGSLIKPIIVRQYLSPMVPFVIVALSASASDRIFSRRMALPLILLVGASVSISYAILRSHVKDAEQLAAFVGAQVSECPSTRVIAVAPWYGRQTYVLPIEPAVVRNAFQELAGKYRFHLGGPASAVCPTIYWGEKADPPGAHLLPAGRTIISHTGYVIIVPPAAPRD